MQTPSDRRFERPSTFDSLEEIVAAAQDYAAEAFADEEAAYRFVLAVSEAVSNAIEHGNAQHAGRQVVVAFRAGEGDVEATVADEGPGFDPSRVENPTEEANLARTRGRGLHIIREVADEVDHEDGGRRVRMRFRRDA